ncbi:MAG: hypothetical protein AAF467_23960 [Actinomycetota bacterium]
MEHDDVIPASPSQEEIERLADRMLASHRRIGDDLSSPAQAALDAALPGLREKYERSQQRQ